MKSVYLIFYIADVEAFYNWDKPELTAVHETLEGALQGLEEVGFVESDFDDNYTDFQVGRAYKDPSYDDAVYVVEERNLLS